MDKQFYKDQWRESFSELSEIHKLIEETPNNMELGKKVRLLYQKHRDARDLENSRQRTLWGPDAD